eukprot:gene511-981_t
MNTIFEYAQSGDLAGLKNINIADVDINATDWKLLYNELTLAAENGFADIVKILCHAGADKNVINQFGKTALIIAAEFNYYDVVKILLEEGAEKDHIAIRIESRSPYKLPINTASTTTTTKRINDNDRYPDKQMKRGMTALMYASMRGHIEVVRLLLEANANVYAQTPDGDSALTLSFISSDIAVTVLLFEHGVNKFLINTKTGCTPLMKAAEHGRQDIVKLLINNYTSDQKKFICMETSFFGWSAMNLLTKYYIHNEEDFATFVKTSGTHPELFEMMPKILPRFRSPNIMMNIHFTDLLYSLKSAPDLDVVASFIYLAVSIYVDNVFWACLRQSNIRNLYSSKDFFQMRSCCAFLRTCPAANFLLDAVSQLVSLVLVAMLLTGYYTSDYFSDDMGRLLEALLVVFVTGGVLHKYGEIVESGWGKQSSFHEIWNYVDLTSLLLLTCWAILLWQGDHHHNIAYHYHNIALNSTSTSSVLFKGGIGDMMLSTDDAKACLALSAVPLAIGMLRYLSLIRPVGEFIFLIFAITVDLSDSNSRTRISNIIPRPISISRQF